MTEPIKAVLMGAGGRGFFAFGGYATKNPEDLKFIAVAEPDEYRRNRFGDVHNISSENRFNTWEDLLKVPKLASVLFNATGDDTHYLSSMSAMDKGYDVVLEKPMASTSEECSALVEKSDKLKKKLIIFHELRYTSFFQKVYEIVNSGKLGDIITVEHRENVVYWHYAHSFVRGTWRNTRDSAPFILAKCCHDLDLLFWIIGKKVKKLSSFGSLKHFKLDQAPNSNVPDRCTDGCPVEDSCIYYAPRLYSGFAKGYQRIFELDEVTSGKSLNEILSISNYGRCVYKSDNNVVDNQTVNLEFENGVLASFITTAHTNKGSRFVRFDGTKGTLIGEFSSFGSEIKITDHLSSEEESVNLGSTYDDKNHGGGDENMLKDIVQNLKNDLTATQNSVHDAFESHLMALAAEESRENNGSMIEMDEYRARFI